jgi:hypothetical protein
MSSCRRGTHARPSQQQPGAGDHRMRAASRDACGIAPFALKAAMVPRLRPEKPAGGAYGADALVDH